MFVLVLLLVLELALGLERGIVSPGGDGGVVGKGAVVSLSERRSSGRTLSITYKYDKSISMHAVDIFSV